MHDPIATMLEEQDVVILDGGLATELEARGWNLDDELWSARLLLEAPEEIRQVHVDFLIAGADCITTSTYQASLPGFLRRGLGETEATELLRESVGLAIEAREIFWDDPANRPGRCKPLVAASIGPYGAYLADGSEYKGCYDVDYAALYAFHHGRWVVLANSEADLLACETIPSVRETEVLLKLIAETSGVHAWMTFSCRDGSEISDGTPIEELAAMCDAESSVAAIGVNCTPPQYISSLVEKINGVTDKPIVVYPNSGERYDPASKTWLAAPAGLDVEWAADDWIRRGAVCIGGCCRIGPQQITALRRRVISNDTDGT
jgi:homocysteine S-methyltransferase